MAILQDPVMGTVVYAGKQLESDYLYYLFILNILLILERGRGRERETLM